MMRVLWSASDPGGGNAILPVLRALARRGDSLYGIAGQPASGRIAGAGLECVSADASSETELREMVERFSPDIFLAGTSAGKDSVDERLLRILTIPSVFVMDFWSNYRIRFSAMPTAICVIDEKMRDEMIAEGFNQDVLHVTGNPYFDHFEEGISRTREHPDHILFISQPVSKDPANYGFDEFDVLKGIIRALPERTQLFIRLHPRDKPHKYDSYLTSRVSISKVTTLEEALSDAGTVIGMFSPVLMQAAAAGKTAISFEPNLIAPDTLPTNQLGLTVPVHTESDLRRILALQRPSVLPDFHTIFPTGATERVVAVLDHLFSESSY